MNTESGRPSPDRRCVVPDRQGNDLVGKYCQADTIRETSIFFILHIAITFIPLLFQEGLILHVIKQPLRVV